MGSQRAEPDEEAAGQPRGRLLRVSDKELEDAGRIVRVPVPRHVCLSQPDRAAKRDPAEEVVTVDAHAKGLAAPEAAHAAVGERDVERAALQALQRPEDGVLRGPRDPSGRSDAGSKLALRDAHRRTEPTPGTNGGLRWNGVRFASRRSAWRWMCAITCTGSSG